MKKEKELLARTLLGSSPSTDSFNKKFAMQSQQLPKVKGFGQDTENKLKSSADSAYFQRQINTPQGSLFQNNKSSFRGKSQNEERNQNSKQINNYTNQIKEILEKIDDPEFSETRTKQDALYKIKSQNLFMQGPLTMKARELGLSANQFKRNLKFPPKITNQDQQQNSNSETQQTTSPNRQILIDKDAPLKQNQSDQKFYIRDNFQIDQSPSRNLKQKPQNRYMFASPKGSIDNLMKNIEAKVQFKNNNNNLKNSRAISQNDQYSKYVNNQFNQYATKTSQDGYLKDQLSQDEQDEINHHSNDLKFLIGSDREINIQNTLNAQKSLNFNFDELKDELSKTLQAQYSSLKKNSYTGLDTRFEEIKKLNSENSKLKNQIFDIKNELEELDEFKIALEHQQKAQDINELRFFLLKAQISRQQKHIRRLTGLLQGSRKVVKEVLAICQFFAESVMRQSSEIQQQVTKKSKKSQNNQANANKAINIQNEAQNNEKIGTMLASQDNPYLPNNEDGIIMQLDQKLMNLSLKNLLSNIGSTEERDNFINNFYSAYSKIVEYERSNKEFSSMFAIKHFKKLALPDSFHNSLTNLDKSGQNSQLYQEAFQQAIMQNDTISRKETNNKETIVNKVKYKYPVKEFLDKYRDYIPINTIFTSFPSQQKDNLNNMMNVLSNVLRKCEKGFKQVRTFQLYKSNPFLYIDKRNRVDLPDTLQNYKSDFETFMKYRDKMTSINLSYDQLTKTESQLSQLLSNLLTAYQQAILDNKSNPNQEISVLIDNLRKSIEQMICLGVMLHKDSGSNNSRYLVVAQNINQDLSLMAIKNSDKQIGTQNEIKDEQNSSKHLNSSQLPVNLIQTQTPNVVASPDESQLGSQHLIMGEKAEVAGQSKRKLKLMFDNKEKLKMQQQLLDELKDYEQLRTLKLEKDIDCNTEFFDRHQICENIFDDLYKSIKQGDTKDSINIALKMGTIIQKLKQCFEMKNNMLLVKEMQIDYLKNQIYVYKYDILQCKQFIEESQEAINNFFYPINTKLNQILIVFNQVMDGSKQSDAKSRKNFILTFKKNLKEILEIIKRIEEKNAPINQLNIKQLKDAFYQKVDLACMKHESIKRHQQS
ncbi:hypothetical protein TTHERM_00426390 (macronuclear) [Tetrahymena thermophila SB210]|uniref:Uncharacterized protein n=1 Tax=Tetrahymena thermophila (strain SB210) TaxID=312017 RepID=Q23AC0_TETTS|nr:hypothetical protein TTHERM_00426390 [Tetrahymena thermophila SB210]EAR93572.3 hypothetical protein TTHERM_00426390 [Tetrahymena thermophila SB210]|eukprot:XP_001013817.3 hypothetical protein TTHERM_00426390 [Tetrahymena thermophila SB210]